ncbi:MAG: HAMP domain-containing methyl-accepting chemotaxis protein [Terracidiphilus sp.]|nr:HAMP domain-containing methyl-accepting chemotaxis protein [Terracidiphilus sp.]
MLASLKDVNLSKKFLVSFGINCALCLVLGLAAITGIARLNHAIVAVVDDAMPSMRILGDIRYDVATVRRTDSLMLLCPSQDCVQHYQDKRGTYINSLRSDVSRYASMVDSAEEKSLNDTIQSGAEAYIGISNQENNLVLAGKKDEASALLIAKNTQNVYNGLVGAVEKDIAFNDKTGSELGQNAVRSGRILLYTICVVLLITLLLCAGVGVTLTRMIVPPLEEATAALEKLADKDLTAQQVEAHGSDEVGRLATALNKSTDSIRAVISVLAHSSDTLSNSSSTLLDHAQQGQINAETQSSKTSQIASAVTEMTATIGEISNNAESAALASRKSTEAAEKGGEVMHHTGTIMEQIGATTATTSGKMESLAQRTDEIGKVVTVIQEISEQTNLLALNAAIEAARAGEHGRGFAVVAGEVRRLAERTKSATEEISETIRSIQQETRETAEVMEQNKSEVMKGVTETERAQQSLDEIITATQNVEHMVQLIATAATEQTAASNEISNSTGAISNLAHENSSAAEVTSEACHDLNNLATEMKKVIAGFQIAR